MSSVIAINANTRTLFENEYLSVFSTIPTTKYTAIIITASTYCADIVTSGRASVKRKIFNAAGTKPAISATTDAATTIAEQGNRRITQGGTLGKVHSAICFISAPAYTATRTAIYSECITRTGST